MDCPTSKGLHVLIREVIVLNMHACSNKTCVLLFGAGVYPKNCGKLRKIAGKIAEKLRYFSKEKNFAKFSIPKFRREFLTQDDMKFFFLPWHGCKPNDITMVNAI